MRGDLQRGNISPTHVEGDSLFSQWVDGETVSLRSAMTRDLIPSTNKPPFFAMCYFNFLKTKHKKWAKKRKGETAMEGIKVQMNRTGESS